MEPSPSSSSGTQISRFSFSSASSSSGERRLSVASETISLNETSSSIALQPSPSSLGDMASVLSGSASKENSLLPSQFHQGDYVSSTLKNAQKMYALMEAYCGTNNNSGGASLGMGMGTHPAGGTYYPPYFTNNNTPESGNGDMSGASLYRQTSLNGTTVPHHLQQQQQQPIIMAKSASVSSGVSHASSMRTVYLGNLPPLLTYEALLNNIQVGVIEHIKLFEEKNCAFLTFVEASVAAQFMMEYSPPPGSSIPANKFVLQGRDIKIGWGKNTLPSETLLLAVKNGASRHVLVSNVPDSLLGLETIETTFSMFGPIDQIRLSPERNVVSVHLISITAAIKAIVTLSMDPTWAQCRIQYGRDRCVPGDDSNHGLAAQVDPASTQSHQTQQQQPSMGLARPAPHVSIGGVSPWQLSAGPVNGDVHQRYSSPPVSHHYQQQSLSGYGGNNVAGQMGRGLLYQSSMHQANNTEQTPFGEQTYQMSQQNQHGSAPSLSINTNMQAPYGFPNHVSNGHAHTYSSSPTGSLGNGQPVSASMSNGAPSPVSQFPNWMGNRTVYLGGIHPDVTTKDLCDAIRGGILQNIKYMQDKNICFVTFIEASSAASFYNRGITEGLVLKGKRLKFGWGKPTPLPHTVASAVLHLGASRNVYIGALDSSISEDKLRQDFVEFGEIELVNMVPEKNIGFVNFTDIMSAVKTVELMRQQLQQEGVMTVGSGDYTKYKINFGKDRCGNPPRPPRHAMAHPNGMGSNGMSMIPQIPSPPVTSPTDSAYDSPLYAHAQINTGAKLYSSGNGTAGLYPSSTTPPVNYTMLSNGLYDSPPSSSMTGGVSPLSNTSVRHLTPPMSPVPPLDTSSCLHARTHSANSNNSEIMMHQSHHHHRIMSSLGLETDDFDMDLSRLVLEDKALI